MQQKQKLKTIFNIKKIYNSALENNTSNLDIPKSIPFDEDQSYSHWKFCEPKISYPMALLFSLAHKR